MNVAQKTRKQFNKFFVDRNLNIDRNSSLGPSLLFDGTLVGTFRKLNSFICTYYISDFNCTVLLPYREQNLTPKMPKCSL